MKERTLLREEEKGSSLEEDSCRSAEIKEKNRTNGVAGKREKKVRLPGD